MWVHAVYIWDGIYWILKKPTSTFVTGSSDADVKTQDTAKRVFPFPCTVGEDFKFQFTLPDRRLEIDWRSTDALTGNGIPAMALPAGKPSTARASLLRIGHSVRQRFDTTF